MRNALAAALKKEGDADAAAAVKALKKPAASAWAVNQLFWRHRDVFDELLASGDAYREAQRAALAGGDDASLERAEAERRRAVATAQRRAEDLLAEGGQSLSAVVLNRVATTLEALASYGHANPSPYDGCSSDDLEPPGFAALATLAPVSPRTKKPKLRPTPAPSPEPREPRESREPQARDAEVAAAAEAAEAVEAAATAAGAERQRRELDAAIDETATKLAAARDDVLRAEKELASARDREAELAKEWETLKGRRREMG